MSDMLLENDPPPAPAALPDSPPVTVAPPEPEPIEEVDLNEIDPKDEAKNRALIAELSRKRAELRDLKPKAEEAAQLKQLLEQYRPYVEVLQQNPGLLRQPQPAPVAPAPEPRTEDSPEAVEAAKLFDFYKSDGTPDAVRGAKHLQLVKQMAQQAAREQVAPMQQQTSKDKSAMNFQRAMAFTTPTGQKPNPQTLQAIWSNTPVEDTANDNVAGIYAALAIGLDTTFGRGAAAQIPHVAAPARAPLVTEAAGDPSGGRARVTMSDLEREIAQKRGMSDQKWQETTKGFHAGRSNNLED